MDHAMADLHPEIETRLKLYHSLLLKWQKSLNLISPSTIEDSWNRHFTDSAQLAKYISIKNPVIVDLGSGGGFPGMVLAIMVEGSFHLVESDNKKCIFLREVSRETKTKTIIHNNRIENISIPHIDYITSRACASVSQLLSWSQNLVSHETRCLFLKGKNYSIEIDEANKEWHFDVDLHPSITEKESAILELSHIRRRE